MSFSKPKLTEQSWHFFFLVIILWVFSFAVFYSRAAPLMSDAVSFYDHLKFYIDNMIRGVYPLWDPLWSYGSPNDFFLRRIGPFNPFLLLLAIPYTLGLSFWAAFMMFVTFYFFLGMAGFYLISKELTNDRTAARIAFAALSFSSLSTRVFDSYIMMFMTPMIWFFYFALIFAKSEKRFAFLGMVFCGMLLMTTYIPFYFLTLALTALVFLLLIYPRECLQWFKGLFLLMRKHPVLFGVSLLGLLAACVPGFLFFRSANAGNFTMPLRHFDSQDPNVLSVKAEVTTYWAVLEELLYSSFYLEDLRQFNFATFYMPLFVYVLLLMGVITRVNRKVLFCFLTALFLFLLGSPYLTPLYGLLHEKIIFLKYFRNLHFFLWLAILPLVILLMAQQFRALKEMCLTQNSRQWLLPFVICVHAGLAVFLVWRESFNISTWICWALSFAGFVLYVRQRISERIFAVIVFAAIISQPLEAYQHLGHNVFKCWSFSAYDHFKPGFEYAPVREVGQHHTTRDEAPAGRVSPLYFGTRWYTLLWNEIPFNILRNCRFNKLILYDRAQIFDEQKDDLRMVQEAWRSDHNVVFLAPGSSLEGVITQKNSAKTSRPVSGASDELRVIAYDANHLKLQTHLDRGAFLVYNDGYYPGWRAYLDGKPTELYRANIAFKGVWVPSGRHTLEFRFGSFWQYGLEIGLLVFVHAFFIFFVRIWYLEYPRQGRWLENVRNV